jgi:hypothetical protein
LRASCADGDSGNFEYRAAFRTAGPSPPTLSARRRFIATSRASSWGEYIGKHEGFSPSSASLHNCMSGHGPDNEAYERGCKAGATPRYLDDTLAFLFETQLVVRPTRFALESEILERNYFEHWQSIKKLFQAPPADQPDPIGRRN